MKLKGKSVEKIPSKKRDKMENTLKRMEDNRNNDALQLRNKLNKKIEDLNIEFEKAEKIIEATESRVIEYKEMRLRIEGAIISLKEIIQNDANV